MCLDLPLKTPDEVHLISLNETKGNLFSLLIFERFGLPPLSLEKEKQYKRLGIFGFLHSHIILDKN